MGDRNRIVIILLRSEPATRALAAYRYVRQLQDTTSNAHAARAQPIVYSQTPIADLGLDAVRTLRDSGIPVTNEASVFAEALVAIAPSFEGDARWATDSPTEFPGHVPLLRMVYRQEQAESRKPPPPTVYLVPESLLASVFPQTWIDRMALRSAFPNDTFTRVVKPLKSPFAHAADELAKNHPAEPAVPFLRAADDVIDHLPPEAAARFIDALVERVKGPQRPSDHETAGPGQLTREMVETRHERATRQEKPEGHLAACCEPLPRGGRLTPVDSMLYLALVGRLQIEVPERVAAAARGFYFEWPDSLDALRALGQAELGVPEIPPFGVRLDHVVSNAAHELVVIGPECSTTLARGWVARGQPVLDAMKAAPSTQVWPHPPEAEALMRVGMRMVWLDSVPPPANLPVSPGDLMRLTDSALSVASCMDVFRPFAHVPDDAMKRADAWQAVDRSPDAEIVRRIAEGLLVSFEPWPDPYTLRAPDHPSWAWSPADCVERGVRDLFAAFVAAPLADEPPNLVATFLYLVASEDMVCLAWPTAVVEGWGFKVSTGDHTWISGTIWTLRDGAPLARLEWAKEDGGSGWVIRCGRVECVIREAGA